MKKAFLLIFIISISLSSKAQKCDNLIETKYDEMTDITIISMKDRMYINDKNGQKKISLFIAQKIEEGINETVLTIDIKNGGCIDNLNGIIFLFTDGTRLKQFNHGASNCNGFAMLNIGVPDYEDITIKSYLEKKKIKTLRVYTNNSFIEVDFTEANQLQLINTLKCIN